MDVVGHTVISYGVVDRVDCNTVVTREVAVDEVGFTVAGFNVVVIRGVVVDVIGFNVVAITEVVIGISPLLVHHH